MLHPGPVTEPCVSVLQRLAFYCLLGPVSCPQLPTSDADRPSKPSAKQPALGQVPILLVRSHHRLDAFFFFSFYYQPILTLLSIDRISLRPSLSSRPACRSWLSRARCKREKACEPSHPLYGTRLQLLAIFRSCYHLSKTRAKCPSVVHPIVYSHPRTERHFKSRLVHLFCPEILSLVRRGISRKEATVPHSPHPSVILVPALFSFHTRPSIYRRVSYLFIA